MIIPGNEVTGEIKKKYVKKLDGYEGRLLFVGINYDENVLKYIEKTHSG